jgi:hypothetical protein
MGSVLGVDDEVGRVEVVSGAQAEAAIARGKPVVIATVASWCGYCKMLEPEYERAARASAAKTGVSFLRVVASVTHGDRRVNVEPEFCERYDVNGFPTLMTCSRPGEWSTYEGPREASALEALAEKLAIQS